MRVTTLLRCWMYTLALSGALVLPMMAAQAQNADAIKARKANYDLLNDQMKAIKAVIDKGGSPADAAAPAKIAQQAALKIPTMFPADSQTGDTKALPNVWSDPEGFKKLADAAGAQSAKLVAATGGTDLAALQTEFTAMGKTCGACHQVNRAK
ncbi:MAG TPA: cytochrome c [Stellaceae bacterium]|nr:cytochrome c [Stellaceae bacterium]